MGVLAEGRRRGGGSQNDLCRSSPPSPALGKHPHISRPCLGYVLPEFCYIPYTLVPGTRGNLKQLFMPCVVPTSPLAVPPARWTQPNQKPHSGLLWSLSKKFLAAFGIVASLFWVWKLAPQAPMTTKSVTYIGLTSYLVFSFWIRD